MSALIGAKVSREPAGPLELSLDRPSISRAGAPVLLACLLAIALLCRLGGISGAVTEDEDQWMARAGNFAAGLMSGDPSRTYQTGHPGVVPMWLVTLSLGTGRTAELNSRGRTDFVVTTLPQFLADLRQARIPFLVLSAMLCVSFSALAWRLLGSGPGLLSGALLVTDPYWSAMSAVVGMDALLAGFLGISLFALLLALSEPRRAPVWIACSGLAFGLAALTKTSAAYMLPALLAVVLAAKYTRLKGLPFAQATTSGSNSTRDSVSTTDSRRAGLRARASAEPREHADARARRPALRRSLRLGETRFGPARLLAIWLAAAGLVYYVFWPAMWTQPVGTLFRAIDFSARLGGAPHAPGNFLLGSTAEDPGPLFYPVAIAFRLGPATTAGLLMLLAFGTPRRLTKVTWLVLLASCVFLLLLTVSPKKIDRYLMPLGPPLIVLAAIGWWSGLQWLANQQRSPWPGLTRLSGIVAGLAVAVAALQVWPLVAAGRYPLAAYNPLVGGARAAERAIPVGWGEGLDDTAAIIRQLSDGASVTTSIWFPLRVNFQAHMPGPVVTERQLGQANYFVDYVHARQRRHTPPQLQRSPPDAVVSIAGVDYARIYRVR